MLMNIICFSILLFRFIAVRWWQSSHGCNTSTKDEYYYPLLRQRYFPRSNIIRQIWYPNRLDFNIIMFRYVPVCIYIFSTFYTVVFPVSVSLLLQPTGPPRAACKLLREWSFYQNLKHNIISYAGLFLLSKIKNTMQSPTQSFLPYWFCDRQRLLRVTTHLLHTTMSKCDIVHVFVLLEIIYYLFINLRLMFSHWNNFKKIIIIYD